MIHHLIILSILLIVQTYLFLYFYDSIETDEYTEIKKYGELISIILFTAITTIIYLKNKFMMKHILIITGIYEIIIILFWVYLNYIYESKNKKNNGVLVGDNTISDNGIIINTDKLNLNNSSTVPVINNISSLENGGFNNNSLENGGFNNTSLENGGFNNNSLENGGFNNNSLENGGFNNNSLENGGFNNTSILNIFESNKKSPKPTQPNNTSNNSNIFSKYIDTDKVDFSFHPLYPKKIESTEKKKSKIKDYSAYNGYSENNICNECKCIKNENDDIFCGKSVAGFGVIGCSEKWKCNTCKDCQSWDDEGIEKDKKVSNNTDSKDYECKNCECTNTVAGKVCGKRARIDGQFIKCKSHCVNCGNCGGGGGGVSSNTGSYITYYPKKKINIDNIIINNISKIDIDNIL